MIHKETSGMMSGSKTTSFEQTSRRFIGFSLIVTAVTSSVLVSILFSFSLVKNLSDRNLLTVEHNTEVFGRQIAEAYHDISLVANSPVIINSLISIDREKIDPVLSALLLRTGGELAGISDADGRAILGYSRNGNESYFRSQLNRQEIYRVTAAGKGVVAGHEFLFIAVPIRYYGKTQGYLEVHFDLKKYVKKYLDTEYQYQIIHGSDKVIFANSDAASYLMGKRSVESSIENVDTKLYIKQFLDHNPFITLFKPLLLLVLSLIGFMLVLSFFISKKIAARMVDPLKRLVHKVSSSQKSNWLRCAPLGADQELEYLAEAFDQKTSELLEINLSLEEKVKIRTDDYLKEKMRAEDALKMRSEFIANMSHEIRTPLNGIIGMAEIISEELKESSADEKIKIIKQSGKLLLSIINDILDFSKIESKQVVLEKIPFSLLSVIQNVIYSLEGQAEGKAIALVKEIDQSCQGGVLGDPTRLSQVLFNLVGNSIKFTEHGAVTIKVKEKKRTNQSLAFDISIIDTGIGIAKDRISGLFEAFSQADGSITRRFGGSGLGLTISKQLIEMMGGSITVDSTLGKGSTFIVSLELETCELNTEATNRPDSEKTFTRNPKILLAEDNKVNQVIAVAFLKSLGLKCEIANNGLEAVEMAKKTQYELIFMDMQMPLLDGLEATRKIKMLQGYEDVMIVALTANAFTKDRQRCFDAGMIDYLSKPLTKKSLTILLNKLLIDPPSEKKRSVG